MLIMSELHRKIIRNKFRKIEFDVDLFATEVENFAKDYTQNPIEYTMQRNIEDYIQFLRKNKEENKSCISNAESTIVNSKWDLYDGEEVLEDSQIQQRFAERLASDIREVLAAHKMQKVAALTLCYKLRLPSQTRILLGLCTPVQLKRCRIKKRHIFKDKEINVVK